MSVTHPLTTLDELRKPAAIAQYHAADKASMGICQSIYQLTEVMERCRQTAIALHDEQQSNRLDD